MRTLTHRAARQLPAALAILALAATLPLAAAKGPASAVPAHPDDKTIIHVLNRIGFGPRPGDVERIRAMGLQAYIDQQLHPDRIPDTGMAPRLASLETLSKSSREIAEEYLIPGQIVRRQQQREQGQGQPAAGTPSASAQQSGEMQNPEGRGSQQGTPGAPPLSAREMRTPEQMQAARAERTIMTDLSEQKVLRAAYSDRQLEEVMVDFWFNHFNVFAGKGATRGYLTEYERDAIRPHVFGKFRDLLGATAESPGDALLPRQLAEQRTCRRTNHGRAEARRSSAGRTEARPSADAGPSRSAPSRCTVPPAGAARPAGGAESPAARDQRELRPRADGAAHARRGRRLHAEGRAGSRAGVHRMDDSKPAAGRRLRLRAAHARRRREDSSSAIESRPAADSSDGEAGARHPGRAPVDRALHRDQARPPVRRRSRRRRPLVDRAAQRFHDTDGDIREVVRTIVTSPEFFAAEAYRAKVKTPFRVRRQRGARDRTDTTNGLPLVRPLLRNLGHAALQCQPPTGYADRADAWVNTGALLARMNFAVSLTEPRTRAAVRAPAPLPARS